MLQTLGGLAADGAGRARKPLLVLCFLVMEGTQPRRRVAELLWPDTRRPLSNLSVALSTLRRLRPGSVGSDAERVWAELDSDVHALLRALEAGDLQRARALYRGPFLHGVELRGCSPELEEWSVTTREFVAARLRAALLRAAELGAAAARGAEAASLAHEAYAVAGAPPVTAGDLPRLHALLVATGHPTAGAVAAEASELGLALVAAPPTAAAPPGWSPPPLPTAATPLIGRDLELTEVAGLLASSGCPLLVIQGPGGIGKSRLALQVAYEHNGGDRFPDGSAFLGMEAEPPEADPSELVARHLAIAPPGHDPPAELVDALRARRMLLVLDCVEHLHGIAAWADGLVAACPGLKVVLTSRRRIAAAHAWTFPLRGLPLPDPAAAPEDAVHADAVRLFVQAARRADARFVLAPEALPQVRRVCRAVEGSPLGIELAAAWVRAVPLADLADELERDLGLLGAAGGAPPAPREDLRGSFERSWAHLRTHERQALARLSVFRGGFALGAAREVAGASIPTLAALVDASLLRVSDDGRYDRHPLVQQFARERLRGEPEVEERMVRRHAQVFLGRLRSLTREGRAPGAALSALEPDFENVRTAWRGAVALREGALLADAALPLARVCDARARLRDGAALFGELLDGEVGPAGDPSPAPDGWSVALGRARLARAWMWLRLGRYREAEAEAERGAALLQDGRDVATLAWAMHTLGTAAYKDGRYPQAEELFQRMFDAAERAADATRQADALGRLALVAQARGRDEEARLRYRAALELSRVAGNPTTAVTQLLNLGALELNLGRTKEAERLFRRALTRADAVGYEQVVPILLHNLANVTCKRGEIDRARELAGEALERVRRSGERGLESGMLATMGWIELEAGRPADGEARAREALQVAHAIADEPAALTAIVRLAQVWLALGRGDRARPALEAAIGHPGTLTWARRLAERLRDGLSPAPVGEPEDLPPDALAVLVDGILEAG